MSISSLVKSTIINGASTLSVAVQNGIIYRLQPVEEMQPIVLEGFVKNRPKTFFLSNVLDQDYKIVGVTADLPDDDDENDDKLDENKVDKSVTTHIRIIKRDRAEENITLSVSSYMRYMNPLYINHNDTWKIKAVEDINKITFRCVPAIINTPKVLS